MSDQIKTLSRADFLKAKDNLKLEPYDLPELGGAVYLRELGTPQLMAYNDRIKTIGKRGKKDVSPSTSLELMALLVSMSACDEEGNLLFSEKDAATLQYNNPVALLKLSVRIAELSGMANESIQEVAANLKKAQTDSSPIT
jgi:hypothetical protein